MTIEFKLTKGAIAHISPEDSDLLLFKWSEFKGRSGNTYAKSSKNIDGKQQLLHRMVLGRMLGKILKRTELVDHIDGNGFNCVRSNLRLATGPENAANARLNSTNTSGYRGVSFNKKSKKWNAKIRINGKLSDLGCYSTAEEAYEVYKVAAIAQWGEFAKV